METMCADVAVIGGGPAGLAAAWQAREAGAGKVMLIERDFELGGILQQCIHPGFGLRYFKEELTGPEYAERFMARVREAGIEVKLNTMVLEIVPQEVRPQADQETSAGAQILPLGAPECTLMGVNRQDGVLGIRAKAVVLAMGCRERTRGAIAIPGERPAGIYTAGTAQRFINMEGLMPGRQVVILGSGDIGLIMARRLTLEGAQVKAVVEIMPRPGGLERNLVQCLYDFDIPLLLQHTVTQVHGRQRVEGVTIAAVDENSQPVAGTEQFIACDTLLLSVGLIPEIELCRGAGVEIHPVTGGPVVNEWRQTSIPSIFACGNLLHVHDLVDNVTREAEIAGRAAARYSRGKLLGKPEAVNTAPGRNVRYVVPQSIRAWGEEEVQVYFRVLETQEDVYVVAKLGEQVVARKRQMRVQPPEMVSLRLRPQVMAESRRKLVGSEGPGAENLVCRIEVEPHGQD